MRRYLPIFLTLALLAATGCLGGPQQPPETTIGPAVNESAPSGVLPADSAEGWEKDWPDSPVKNYTQDNIYLYLGQKADLYNKYGLKNLTHAVYRANLLAKPSVVLDVYEMNLPLHAYGIFSVERNRDDKAVDVGAGGNIGEKECVFWKGKHFVRVSLIDEIDQSEETMLMFANTTAKLLPESTGTLAVDAFPKANRIASGDAYYVDNLMGYDCLGRGFTVDYDLPTGKATMYLAIVPPAVVGSTITPTVVTYSKFRIALKADGEAAEILPGPWEHACTATNAKLGSGIMARQGRYIAGIFGAPDKDTAIKMTAELLNNLP